MCVLTCWCLSYLQAGENRNRNEKSAVVGKVDKTPLMEKG